VKAYAAFCRTTPVIVLHHETPQDDRIAIIHEDWQGKMVFTHGNPQEFAGWLIQFQKIGAPVELFECHIEYVVGGEIIHGSQPLSGIGNI